MNAICLKWPLLLIITSLALAYNTLDATGLGSASFGRCSFEENDFATLSSCPALLMGSKSTFYLSLSSYQSDFQTSTGVIQNEASSTGEVVSANYDSDFSSQFSRLGNFSSIDTMYLKGFYWLLESPSEGLLTIDSDQANSLYTPRYTFYQSKAQAVNFKAGLVFKLASQMGLSLSARHYFKTEGELLAVARDSGSDIPSSGAADLQVTSGLAPELNFYTVLKGHEINFLYQGSHVSKLNQRAQGVLPLGVSEIPFEWTLNTVIDYHPEVYSLSMRKAINQNFKVILGIEHQNWSAFEESPLQIERQSGVLISSENLETTKLNNLTLSYVSAQYTQDKNQYSVGMGQRNSLTNSGENGNLDNDTLLLGLGYQRSFTKLKWNLGVVYQQVSEKTVAIQSTETITPIGSPAANVGGTLTIINTGLIFTY